MLLALLSIAAGVLVGVARGGRLEALADVRLAGIWLVGAAIAAQAVVALSGLTAGTAPTRMLLAVSHVALVLFAWRNRIVRGIGLVLLGVLLNAAVVTANGAMPVDGDAAARIGTAVEDRGTHRALQPGDRLTPLADVIAVPALRAVISVGDVVLASGLAVLTAGLVSPRRREQPDDASTSQDAPTSAS